MDRIMFAGPSGIGKTTLAKEVALKIGITFVDGSMRTLLPSTKDIPHKDMLNQSKEDLYKQDFQLLNARNKLFKQFDEFITDRSYLDSAAYFIYKQAKEIPQCEVDNFLELSKMLLTRQCDKLIVLDFGPWLIHNWVTEDDGKRISNNYFQMMISSLMSSVLQIWGAKLTHLYIKPSQKFWKSPISYEHGYELGKLSTTYGDTDILVIKEGRYEIRQSLIQEFLDNNLVWEK